MSITLRLSVDQERRLRAVAARQDRQAVRKILRQAADSTADELLRTFVAQPAAGTLPALLDKIAADFHNAPALSDAAVSGAGIYDQIETNVSSPPP